ASAEPEGCGIVPMDHQQVVIAVSDVRAQNRRVSSPALQRWPIEAVAEHLRDADDRCCVPRRLGSGSQQRCANFTLPKSGKPDANAATIDLVGFKARQDRARALRIGIGRIAQESVLRIKWPHRMGKRLTSLIPRYAVHPARSGAKAVYFLRI